MPVHGPCVYDPPGPARRFCSIGRLFSTPSSPTIELRPLGVEPSHPNAPLLLLLGPDGDRSNVCAGNSGVKVTEGFGAGISFTQEGSLLAFGGKVIRELQGECPL